MLLLGLSARDDSSGVQYIRMELLASVQECKEFPYTRDGTASLYSAYLQAWKAAKIIMTAIVCTYNFPEVLLNWVLLNKHFGKSSSPFVLCEAHYIQVPLKTQKVFVFIKAY